MRSGTSEPELHVLETVAELRRVGWDEMLGRGDWYLSTAWLGVLERRVPARASYLFVGGGSARTPLAGTPLYLFGDDSPPEFYRVDDVVRRAARDGGAESSTRGDALADVATELLPAATFGGRHMGRNRLLVHPRLAPAPRRAALETLLAGAERIAHERRASSLVALYVAEDDTELRAVLGEAGYRAFPSAQAAVLDVRWNSFDEYLGSLSRKRREAVRRERRRLEQAGVTFEVVDLDPRLRAEMAPLELNLMRRYGLDADVDVLLDDYRTLEQLLGATARVFVARRGGRLAGFLIGLRADDELYLRQLGFDYELQDDLPLYFGLVFYAVVEYALAEGVSRIDYAVESAEAKRSRGCRLEPQLAYLKGVEAEADARVASLVRALAG